MTWNMKAFDKWSSDVNKQHSGGLGFIFPPFHGVWLHLHTVLQRSKHFVSCRADVCASVRIRSGVWKQIPSGSWSLSDHLMKIFEGSANPQFRRETNQKEKNVKPFLLPELIISLALIEEHDDDGEEEDAIRASQRVKLHKEDFLFSSQLFDCFFMHLLVNYKHLNCFLFCFLWQKVKVIIKKIISFCWKTHKKENLSFTVSAQHGHCGYYLIFGNKCCFS